MTSALLFVFRSAVDVWLVDFDKPCLQVSFVNSICTLKGGTHVKLVIDQICKHLVETINKKNKNANVKDFMVKNHLWLFVNCQIENPAFDSQARLLNVSASEKIMKGLPAFVPPSM
jgi:DNA gyrase/topoisomerase IV subunit B